MGPTTWDSQKTIQAVHALFEARKDSTDILDLIPENRVTWTEVWELMQQHGWTGGVVDGRLAWHEETKNIRWTRKGNR